MLTANSKQATEKLAAANELKQSLEAQIPKLKASLEPQETALGDALAREKLRLYCSFTSEQVRQKLKATRAKVEEAELMLEPLAGIISELEAEQASFEKEEGQKSPPCVTV